MASYSCRRCGRTNFLTSHGLQKHRVKCERSNPRASRPQSEAAFQRTGPRVTMARSSRGFATGPESQDLIESGRVSTGWYDSRATKYQRKDRTMGSGNRTSPIAMIQVPAWEKVGGSLHDASKLRPSGVIADRKWVVYAYASDYNSRNSKGSAYYFSGSGRLTGRDLLKHADDVIAHANKQGAERFFEFFKVVERTDDRTLVVLLFGS